MIQGLTAIIVLAALAFAILATVHTRKETFTVLLNAEGLTAVAATHMSGGGLIIRHIFTYKLDLLREGIGVSGQDVLHGLIRCSFIAHNTPQSKCSSFVLAPSALKPTFSRTSSNVFVLLHSTQPQSSWQYWPPAKHSQYLCEDLIYP